MKFRGKGWQRFVSPSLFSFDGVLFDFRALGCDCELRHSLVGPEDAASHKEATWKPTNFPFYG